jgi:hypothetical protein
LDDRFYADCDAHVRRAFESRGESGSSDGRIPLLVSFCSRLDSGLRRRERHRGSGLAFKPILQALARDHRRISGAAQPSAGNNARRLHTDYSASSRDISAKRLTGIYFGAFGSVSAGLGTVGGIMFLSCNFLKIVGQYSLMTLAPPLSARSTP